MARPWDDGEHQAEQMAYESRELHRGELTEVSDEELAAARREREYGIEDAAERVTTLRKHLDEVSEFAGASMWARPIAKAERRLERAERHLALLVAGKGVATLEEALVVERRAREAGALAVTASSPRVSRASRAA